MEIATVRTTSKFIVDEVVKTYSWVCPNCDKKWEMECDLKQDFIGYLTSEGIRYVKMKYMEGVFCKECYEDPEVQNSSL